MLRSLRRYLQAQSRGHHTTDRLELRSVERESARHSFLKGRERTIVSRSNTGTVSKATLGTPLRDGVERILFSCVPTMAWLPISNSTELRPGYSPLFTDTERGIISSPSPPPLYLPLCNPVNEAFLKVQVKGSLTRTAKST